MLFDRESCKKKEHLTNLNPSTISVRCFISCLCSPGKCYDTSKNGLTSITAIQLLIVFKAKTTYKRHSNSHHSNFIDKFIYIPQLYNNKDLSKTIGYTITKKCDAAPHQHSVCFSSLSSSLSSTLAFSLLIACYYTCS